MTVPLICQRFILRFWAIPLAHSLFEPVKLFGGLLDHFLLDLKRDPHPPEQLIARHIPLDAYPPVFTSQYEFHEGLAELQS